LNEDRGFGLQCQEKEKDICHKGARELPLQVAKAAAIPRKATEDALHITLATVHGMDYLLTWNCKHIGEEGSYLSAIPSFATVVWNGCKEIDSSLSLLLAQRRQVQIHFDFGLRAKVIWDERAWE